MRELTPVQIVILERLLAHGFLPAAYPLYPNLVGVHRQDCAALLAPIEGALDGGGFRIFGEACYLIDGNFSVRLKRRGSDWFVWKGKQIEATAERLTVLRRFSEDLATLLLPSS